MITGTISANDYLDAQRLHRAKGVRWYYALSGLAGFVGVLISLFYERNLGFIVAGAGIGGAVGELVYSALYLPWKVRRLHNQQKDLASPFTYKWDCEILEAQGESGQSHRQWKNYAKCKENEQLFLLYHSDNLFEMFPKSWFVDQEQIEEFRKLANGAKT